uniref:Uncharacterized protein n=1 Tax=Picea glauca TaxID=3330 RepID=A0A101M1P4_PICGL|nr:hypothetical protein ABT39_MTgene3924 [Picea glauca]QHR91039.1 hypothetical protein Q903MT_gene5071 [Picea sitchensis]
MAEVRADTARAVAGLLIRWPGPSGTPPQFIYTRRLTRQRGSPRSSLFSPGKPSTNDQIINVCSVLASCNGYHDVIGNIDSHS